MGSEKLGPQVFHDALLEKERPNGNKEGKKMYW